MPPIPATGDDQFFRAAGKMPTGEGYQASLAQFLLDQEARQVPPGHSLQDDFLLHELIGIRRPTLVIAGANDTVTLASHGEYIAATVPGARLVILPAVHLPNVEHADVYVRTVLEFLLEGESARTTAAKPGSNAAVA